MTNFTICSQLFDFVTIQELLLLKNCQFYERNWDHTLPHGLWTPNEGINQRYLKYWADVADKIRFGRT